MYFCRLVVNSKFAVTPKVTPSERLRDSGEK